MPMKSGTPPVPVPCLRAISERQDERCSPCSGLPSPAWRFTSFGFRAPAAVRSIDDWIYNGVLLLAVAICIVRASVSQDAALDLAFVCGRNRRLDGRRYLLNRRGGGGEPAVSVAGGVRLPARLPVLLRRGAAAGRAPGPLHRQRLARRGDRGTRLGRPWHGHSRSGADRPHRRRAEPRCPPASPICSATSCCCPS